MQPIARKLRAKSDAEGAKSYLFDDKAKCAMDEVRSGRQAQGFPGARPDYCESYRSGR